MANGFGSLYVGASGLQNSQNALNTTANNMANVDTKGYVRQQVLYADRTYVNFDKKVNGISYQQAGLGVTIADVVHTRDIFLDKYYRTETGRQAFYQKTHEVVNEIEDYFQELEGVTYQDTLKDFYVSFQELARQPDSSVNQNLVVQKATVFLERSQAIYEQTKRYQKNMNLQITDMVDRINELGKTILELNKQILDVEAGKVETAMSLRDLRDNALDELSSLVKIDYTENAEGIVKVKIENTIFVDEIRVNQMGLKQDMITDFMTPYWPHMSDEGRDKIHEVFDFSSGVKSENDTDLGKLKALVLARGDHFANYLDLKGLTSYEYNVGLGQSVVMNSQAELDQLIHGIVTSINEILCPEKTVSFTDENGKKYDNVRVWDEERGSTGKDGVKPGHELITRRGMDRYTQVRADDGTIYYVYNEENENDPTSLYSMTNLEVNPILVDEEAYLPHIRPNGEIDFPMAGELAAVWSKEILKLNPNDRDTCSFTDYYQRLMDDLAITGSVYGSLAKTLDGSVTSIENQRQQVVGVSSDEELTNMIKYQNAYNAASRYINVISEMIEHIIMQLGA